MMARETHNMSYLLEPCVRACVQLAAQASYGGGGGGDDGAGDSNAAVWRKVWVVKMVCGFCWFACHCVLLRDEIE